MTTTIEISSAPYADHDDCLAAAAADYVSDHPEAEGWDLGARWAGGDDGDGTDRSTILLDVPADGNKSDVDSWESVATYVCTFSGDEHDGACDVEVRVGEDGGCWYLSTSDDAGGSDDCDDTAYATRDEAIVAAEEFAASRDEGNGTEDAEGYLRRQTEERRGEPDPRGEWCVYWETSLEDSGPRERYATRQQAEASADLANESLRSLYPGALLCGFDVRRLVDGEWERLGSED